MMKMFEAVYRFLNSAVKFFFGIIMKAGRSWIEQKIKKIITNWLDAKFGLLAESS